MDSSQAFSLAAPVSAREAHEHTGHGGRGGAVRGLSNMDSHSTRPTWLQPKVNAQYPGKLCEPQVDSENQFIRSVL